MGINVLIVDDSAEFLRAFAETPHKGKPVIRVTTEGIERTVLETFSPGAAWSVWQSALSRA